MFMIMRPWEEVLGGGGGIRRGLWREFRTSWKRKVERERGGQSLKPTAVPLLTLLTPPLPFGFCSLSCKRRWRGRGRRTINPKLSPFLISYSPKISVLKTKENRILFSKQNFMSKCFSGSKTSIVRIST